MDFNQKLQPAILHRRYKRFLADVELLDSGEIITVHCPNTGSMQTCGVNGDTVLLSYHSSNKRKYPYTWELTKVADGYIGINTGRTNDIVFEALQNKSLKEFSDYSLIEREVSYKDCRFDFRLRQPGKPDCWIEVKNVTLFDGKNCCFPDTVTKRGAKHLRHLIELKRACQRSVMLYIINRPEGEYFYPAQKIDPHYTAILKEAAQLGVEVFAYRTQASEFNIRLIDSVPIRLQD